MTRRWLEQAIEIDYLPAIRALDNTPAGHQAAQQLNERIRQSWHDRGSTALTQQQGLVDDTRRALKAALGHDHWALNYIGFSRDESIELNNIKQGRVADRNEAVQQLDNPDAIVAAAVRLLDSPEWANLAAGLAVLTGRRVAEVLSTAQFEKKTQWSVIFTGALKRRGESVTLSFEIPTLTTADRVIAAIDKLRFELPEAVDLTPAEINQRYEAAVATVCDQTFAPLVPTRAGEENLYTHLFRAVYATIATFWYCPASVNEIEFKAAIQGHYLILDEQNPDKRRSLAAGRHYSDYEISDQEIAHYNGKRKGIKLGVGGIEPIEAFAAAWKKGMEPKVPRAKKTRSSVRIWQEDKSRLNRILERFRTAGTQQQDRFRAFLDWLEERHDHEALPQAQSIAPEPPIKLTPAAVLMQTIAAQPEWEQPEEQEVPTPIAPVAIAPVTESKIDQLIETMTKFMELQMALAPTAGQTAQPARVKRRRPTPTTPNGSTQPEAPKLTDEADQPAAPAKHSSSIPRTKASAEETAISVNQAIDQIMAYNNQPGRRHEEKWAIGINALKAFVGSQEAIVAAIGGKNRKGEIVTGTRQAEVEAHHQKHQIDPDKHNYKHRGKTKIDQVIPCSG